MSTPPPANTNILQVPMPSGRSPGAPRFDGMEVTSFLASIIQHGANAGIINPNDLVSYILQYSSDDVRALIRYMPEFDAETSGKTWTAAKSQLMLLYSYSERVPEYSESMLKAYCEKQSAKSSYSTMADVENRGGGEFHTNIIGEIAGPAHGTVLRAAGNHFTRDGPDFRPVDDSSNVKDILALVVPTLATTRLANLYENQTVPLRTVILDESVQDDGRNYILRPWLRALKDDSMSDDLIIVHMMPKYGSCRFWYCLPSVAPPRRAKRKLDDDSPRTTATSVAVAYTGPPVIPDASEIKLGAFYDPRLLPDYGGPYFNHVQNKLVQLDVRDGTDNTNRLIPPWCFYDRLKPGTLLLVHATLHIFLMGDDKRKRKINAHSIKVLADSDSPVVERHVPMPKSVDPKDAVVADPETSNAFDAFSIDLGPSTSGGVAGPSSVVLADVEVAKDGMDIDPKNKKPKGSHRK
ncbi:hypothetical protein B0H10DRAFT_2443872 [Mycena sp. CBHHK59/15]|nr:hypothetical protein B0H10DRAFT_2443872 [Mycena sp. CBHHK59/15]